MSEMGLSVSPGQILGHYRLAEKIGAGGMGIVYRARDEHLDCDVAVKILPPVAVHNEHARKRFRQEARTLSRLAHPNIAVIHDFDTQDDLDYLVMEFIAGVTLSEKLAGKALREKEVIALGIQLADALSAAHENGVVHSDLKPGNVRITKEGHLKVLDFGLARLRLSASPNAATETCVPSTTVAGTVPYMAPEQLSGSPADVRTDIYAAGCVLYEMATGRHPFMEVDRPRLIAAILRSTPLSPAAVMPGLSAELDRIILKCLEKDPDLRYQLAKELAVDLRRLQTITSSGFELPVTASHRAPGRRILWAISTALLLVAAACLYFAGRWPPVPRVVGTHVLTKTASKKTWVHNRLLTDGKNLYYQEAKGPQVVTMQLPLNGGEPAELPFPSGAAGSLRDISQDGSELLLSVTSSAGDNTWIQPLPSGPARLIAKDARWPIWTPDNRSIIFVRNHDRDLYRVNSDGTALRYLTTVPDVTRLEISPDGQRVRIGPSGNRTLELNADGSNLHRVLGDMGGNTAVGTWSRDGKFYFFLGPDNARDDLWVVPEKQHWWQRGEPHAAQLTFGPLSLGTPAISRDGKQIYAVGRQRHGELVVYDPKRGEFVPFLGGKSICFVDFSRDGKWIAYVSYPEGILWRSRLDGSERRQLTVPPLGVMNPRWSPDGKTVAFIELSGGNSRALGYRPRVYTVSAEGGGPQFLDYGGDPTWSPDGNAIAYGFSDPTQSEPLSEIRIFDLRSHEATKIPGSEGLFSPRWSPDGQYIFASTAHGPPFLPRLFNFSTQKWEELQFSGLAWPCWSADSKFVYGLADGWERMSVADHKLEHVFSLRSIRSAAYWYDRWGYGAWNMTSDGRPVTTRDTGIEEIYAFDLAYE